jgi:hypothetical protein
MSRRRLCVAHRPELAPSTPRGICMRDASSCLLPPASLTSYLRLHTCTTRRREEHQT